MSSSRIALPGILLPFLHVILHTLAWGDTSPSVVELKLPWAVDSIDATRDTSGTLHLAVLQKGRCLYSARPAAGGEFAGPIAVDPAGPAVQANQGDRRPRIQVSPDGSLWILWQEHPGMKLLRSQDAGKTWQRISIDLGDVKEIDVPAMGIGPRGEVVVVWVDPSAPREPDDKFAAHLMISIAPDGERFGEAHRITSDGARACPCCTPAVAVGPEGQIMVAYRSSRANIKESALLRSSDGGRTFTGAQLSNHRWEFIGCPMSGPVIARAGQEVVVGWTSGEDMYCAWSRDAAASFTPEVRLGRGHYIAAAAGDRPLLIWDEGRQTGLWPGSSKDPRPRADIRPTGALVADPRHGFLLLQGAESHR